MKKKVLTSIALSILLLVGCNNINTNSSLIISSEDKNSSFVSTTTIQDMYNQENVDIDFLKDHDCVFLDDLVFAEDEKSHIFRIKNNEIIEHITYPLVEFNRDNYNKVIGKDIIEAVKIIGCPTYIGLEEELSLDFVKKDGKTRRLFLTKEDNKLIVNRIDSEETNLAFSSYVDYSRTTIPTMEQISRLKNGMCIHDVIKTVGKLNVKYSGVSPHSIYLEDEKILSMQFAEGHNINCEHVTFSKDNIKSCSNEYLVYYRLDKDIFLGVTIEPDTSFVTNDDRFMDESIITIDYLKNQHCFFFDNMVFASDKKNHVFFIENDKIKEHKIYDKIVYPKDPLGLFNSVKGMNFLDTFNIIGIPTYMYDEERLILGYSTPYNIHYGVSLDEINGEYVIKNCLRSYKLKNDNIGHYFYNTWRNSRVKIEDVEFIKKDMVIDEVIKIIGVAHEKAIVKDNSTIVELNYYLEDDRILKISFRVDYIVEECEYARINYQCYITSNPSCVVGPNIFYFYVDSINII